MLKVHPFLWFDNEAEQARDFYCAIFRNSRKGAVTRYPSAASDDGGRVLTAEFELEGLPVTALNAGPQYKFNEAVSLFVTTADQAETDYYWNALTADGGEERPCGWLRDKFGLFWQVAPEVLLRLVADPDRRKADRVMQAMFKMKRIVIADIEAAARDEAA